jgi:hypothetical protein
MKTLTIVYDPDKCRDLASTDDGEVDLFGLIEYTLNDLKIESAINLYDGDVRPLAEVPSMLDLLERCRAALPDAWLAAKSNTPRELIDDLNALLRRHGR